MPWESGTKVKVTRKLLAQAHARTPMYLKKALDFGRQAIKELDVYDTGELYNNFSTEEVKKKDAVVIRMRNTVSYGVYPLLGLGNNRKYGPRNWFHLAANKFIASIGAKTKQFKVKQPPSYAKLRKEGQGYSLKSSNREILEDIAPGKGFKRTAIRKSGSAYRASFTLRK